MRDGSHTVSRAEARSITAPRYAKFHGNERDTSMTSARARSARRPAAHEDHAKRGTEAHAFAEARLRELVTKRNRPRAKPRPVAVK
jgi:hypothetical protein